MSAFEALVVMRRRSQVPYQAEDCRDSESATVALAGPDIFELARGLRESEQTEPQSVGGCGGLG